MEEIENLLYKIYIYLNTNYYIYYPRIKWYYYFLSILIAYFIWKREIKEGKTKIFITCKICACVYSFLVISSTILSRKNLEDYKINIQLLLNFRRWIEGTRSFPYYEVYNLFLLFPVGFLYPVIWNRFKKLKNTLGLGLTFSLFIETMQLLLKRGTFEIDDLLLNSLGTFFGFLFYKFCIKVKKKIILMYKTSD